MQNHHANFEPNITQQGIQDCLHGAMPLSKIFVTFKNLLLQTMGLISVQLDKKRTWSKGIYSVQMKGCALLQGVIIVKIHRQILNLFLQNHLANIKHYYIANI